jgi:D-glycero-D-manno-heptose 1,7-bisphosphate phosphatase
MVVNPEHGTIDSPLHPSQVKVYPWVPEALALLRSKNFRIAICTNQPAAAKGKTTKENLEKVHKLVVEVAEQAGGRIDSSHICFHRQEDGCFCRKPKTGLLEDALSRHKNYDLEQTWMVGDGVHDIRAGQTLSLKTAFIGPRKWDAQRVFDEADLLPTLWVENLLEFAQTLCL